MTCPWPGPRTWWPGEPLLPGVTAGQPLQPPCRQPAGQLSPPPSSPPSSQLWLCQREGARQGKTATTSSPSSGSSSPARPSSWRSWPCQRLRWPLSASRSGTPRTPSCSESCGCRGECHSPPAGTEACSGTTCPLRQPELLLPLSPARRQVPREERAAGVMVVRLWAASADAA